MEDEKKEEKKGFWDFMKPKPKPMNNAELQAEIKIQSEALLLLNTGLENVNSTVKSNFETLMEAIEELKLVKSIPDEWIKTINEMKSFNPDLPEIQVCYTVLMAYKNLSSMRGEKIKSETLTKLAKIKTEVEEKKIHNCGKCGKPVEEGGYYKLKNKFYCLEHREEKKGKPEQPKNPGADAL